MRTAALVLTVAVTLTAFSLAQQPGATPPPAPPAGRPGMAPPGPPRVPRAANRPTPSTPDPRQETDMAVEVVQVVCKLKQLPEIDIKPLSAEKLSSTELLKKLGEYGEARMLLRTEQRCNFTSSVKITTGRRVPTVQDISITKDGKVTPSVTYQEVGTIIEFVGGWTDEDAGERCGLNCEIEASTVGKAGIKVASGVQLPTFDQLKINTSVSLTSGQPVVMMTNDYPSAARKAKPNNSRP